MSDYKTEILNRVLEHKEVSDEELRDVRNKPSHKDQQKN
jgi:hypothetical protein